MAAGELRVRTPCPAVGELHRAEQLLLQLVRAGHVELLVRGTERGEREPDLVRRLREGVEHLLPCFHGGLHHATRLVPGPGRLISRPGHRGRFIL